MNKRVLYIQYTNPGGYPPLHHSSKILQGKGYECRFLGTEAFGAGDLSVPNADVRTMSFRGSGPIQKLHHIKFLIWCVAWCLRWRPTFVYASDPLSGPTSLLIRVLLRIPIAYHEHDSPTEWSPSDPGITRWMRLINRVRLALLRQSSLVIVPNERRADLLRDQTEEGNKIVTVWNCPSVREVRTPPTRDPNTLDLWYHGSLTEERVPASILEAIAQVDARVHLTVVGYETVGSQGFVERYRRLAEGLGIGDRLTFHPPLSRPALLDLCTTADVGLAMIHTERLDVNLEAMPGASNKPFDYLACGLALVVNDSPDWREMYVRPGYGVACDPGSADSIAQQLDWLVHNRDEVRAMAERGQKQIVQKWNYEECFRPALARLEELA